MILGLVAGAALGNFFPEVMLSLGFLGRLYLNVLQLLVVPLVVATIIISINAIGGVTRTGRVVLAAVIYFVATSLLAVVLGLVAVVVVSPGTGVDLTGVSLPDFMSPLRVPGVSDFLSRIIPSGPGAVFSSGHFLGVVVLSLLFGGVLLRLGRRARLAVDFFRIVQQGLAKLVGLTMYAAPIGLLSLVSVEVARNSGSVEQAVAGFFPFCVVLLIALAVQTLAILPLLLMFVARRNPVAYFAQMLPALSTAFGTSSPVATLPVTQRCVVDDAGVDDRVAPAVLSLGSVLNTNGTALFVVAAAVFVAQTAGVALSAIDLVVLSLVAVFLPVGIVGLPRSGLLVVLIALKAINLPLAAYVGLGLLAAVEWAFERFRTVTDVWSDAVGAAIVAAVVPIDRSSRGNRERDSRDRDRSERRSDSDSSRGDRGPRGGGRDRDDRRSRPRRGDRDSGAPQRRDDRRGGRPDTRPDTRGDTRGRWQDSGGRGSATETSAPASSPSASASPFAVPAHEMRNDALDIRPVPDNRPPREPREQREPREVKDKDIREPRGDRNDRGDRGDRNERSERSERSDRPDRGDRGRFGDRRPPFRRPSDSDADSGPSNGSRDRSDSSRSESGRVRIQRDASPRPVRRIPDEERAPVVSEEAPAAGVDAGEDMIRRERERVNAQLAEMRRILDARQGHKPTDEAAAAVSESSEAPARVEPEPPGVSRRDTEAPFPPAERSLRVDYSDEPPTAEISRGSDASDIFAEPGSSDEPLFGRERHRSGPRQRREPVENTLVDDSAPDPDVERGSEPRQAPAEASTSDYQGDSSEESGGRFGRSRQRRGPRPRTQPTETPVETPTIDSRPDEEVSVPSGSAESGSDEPKNFGRGKRRRTR